MSNLVGEQEEKKQAEALEEKKRKAQESDILGVKYVEPRFKIDLFYDRDFSIKQNNLGIISIWGTSEEGEDYRPGMEAKIYECPNPSGCSGLVTPETHGGLIAACPKCHRVWKIKELVGERLFVLPIDKWASVIERYVRRLNLDVDIYLKRLKSSISMIEANEKETLGNHRGEVYNKAREMEVAIYTKERLIKDASSGKELKVAIKAFLLA